MYFRQKYIQKDLRLAIALGDAVNHPTPMAAAANEVTAGGCGWGLQTSLVSLALPLCDFALAWLCLTSPGGVLGCWFQACVSPPIHADFSGNSLTCGLLKSVSNMNKNPKGFPRYQMVIDF